LACTALGVAGFLFAAATDDDAGHRMTLFFGSYTESP
jgi:hypothetical protein